MLSVMITAYNSAEYLKSAVASVLAGEYSDFELLVIDDASTDSTPEVVASFNDSRVKSFRNDKKVGFTDNVNKFIGCAAGKYLRILTTCDVLLPGTLTKQVAALDGNATVAVVTCDMFVADEKFQNKLRANFYPGYEKGQKVVRSCCANFANRIGSLSNVMLRKEAVAGKTCRGNGGAVAELSFFCDILQDWDYFNIDEPGVLQRSNSDSCTLPSSKSSNGKDEEFSFCIERVGFSLFHLLYLKENISLLNKLKLCLMAVSSKKAKKVVRLAKYIMQGKCFHSLLLADYAGASVSANIAYSNSNGIISIGENSSIHDFTVVRIENGPCAELETSTLIIGENTYIGEHNNLRAAGGVIRIGNNVLISQMVTIVASNHGTDLSSTIMSQPWIRNSVIIEDDVWIGAGCVILPGAKISKGSIIAANSVVKGLVEPNSVMAGVPARKIKDRS